MKIVYILYYIVLNKILCGDPPELNVNYKPKKQWKISKHDLSDIKLDIEREMRSKILEVQMDWENRERNERQMIYNQGFNQPILIPSMPYSSPINNPIDMNSQVPNSRFYQKEMNSEIDSVIDEQADAYVEKIMNKTLSKLNLLKKELDELKNKNNIENKQTVKKNDDVSDIINKYKSNQATKEFDIFSETFKNFNQTASAMSKIDMNDINKKIKSALSDVKNKFGISNNTTDNQTNFINNSTNATNEDYPIESLSLNSTTNTTIDNPLNKTIDLLPITTNSEKSSNSEEQSNLQKQSNTEKSSSSEEQSNLQKQSNTEISSLSEEQHSNLQKTSNLKKLSIPLKSSNSQNIPNLNKLNSQIPSIKTSNSFRLSGSFKPFGNFKPLFTNQIQSLNAKMDLPSKDNIKNQTQRFVEKDISNLRKKEVFKNGPINFEYFN